MCYVEEKRSAYKLGFCSERDHTMKTTFVQAMQDRITNNGESVTSRFSRYISKDYKQRI